MILVDRNAELVLIRRLEGLRSSPLQMRCLHFEFSKLRAEDRMAAEALVALLQSALDDHGADAALYWMRDGDVLMLRPLLQGKDLRSIALALPESMRGLLQLYEMEFQFNSILLHLEKKLQSYAEAERSLRREEMERESARRREAILGFSLDANTQQRVQQARHGRLSDEVMIIEDDSFSRRLLENALPKTVTITALESPDTALAKYALLVPDVLFLDINLPNVSGHELLERILAIDPNAYVIMISGDADRDNVVKAMSKGARGFIAKPFNRERVAEYLQRCPTLTRKVPHAYS